MRVLSGIQPTGEMHIGNYLGAIKQWLELQEKNECVFFIADLHSLTVPYDSKTLQKNILEATISYIAAGLDPEKNIIFVQSQVKEHTELCWLLNTVCPVGELQRMIQYKEKAKKFKKNINPHTKTFGVGVNVGLLDYPVLMAADILLYKTEGVPVGKDQVQHVELTRIIARKFNQKFGKIFIEPKPLLPKIGAKIMSLISPKKKMSTTDSPQSYISLFDTPATIRKKIMAAVTDPGKIIKYDPSKKPGISNLLTIYTLFGRKPIREIEKEFKNRGYADFKKSLTKLLVNSLEPFRRKKKELLTREVYIREILNQGARKAGIIAQSTMEDVRKRMGLV